MHGKHPVPTTPHLEIGGLADVSSHEVFEILARQNADMLVGYLRSVVRSDDLVDDLFQETMLTAWKKLADFDRTRSFGPWLRGIAANKVRQQRDRSRRDLLRCDDEVLAGIEHRFATMRQQDGLQDVVDTLLQCIRSLPERLRLAIEIVYQHGIAPRLAAVKLDASAEAVKKRVQRGRQLLAVCLRDAGEMA